MKRKGFTFVEIAFTLGIIAFLIAVVVPLWEKTFRDIKIQYLLDTATQGVLYVLGDARGKSIRDGLVYRVSVVTDAAGTPTQFVAGIRDVSDRLLPQTRFEIPKVIITNPYKPYVYDNIQISFEPSGKYYYIFGAWVKEETTSYVLPTSPASTTIWIYLTKQGTTTNAPTRKIQIVNGMPLEVTTP